MEGTESGVHKQTHQDAGTRGQSIVGRGDTVFQWREHSLVSSGAGTVGDRCANRLNLGLTPRQTSAWNGPHIHVEERGRRQSTDLHDSASGKGVFERTWKAWAMKKHELIGLHLHEKPLLFRSHRCANGKTKPRTGRKYFQNTRLREDLYLDYMKNSCNSITRWTTQFKNEQKTLHQRRYMGEK